MDTAHPESFFEPLIAWYRNNKRDLPWRHTRDPWAILVCEVMSQQTPVARVLPVWEVWMERWPTPADFAAATPAEVLVAWGRMGYPRRALRLHECAVIITRDYAGSLPADRDKLRALPGIGDYTADAILAFAFEKRSVVLDTNIRRVLHRWHGGALPPPTQRVAEVRRADTFIPSDAQQAAEWNAAIMEFGALVCTARTPACAECPFQHACQWFQAGRPEDPHAHRRRTQAWEGTNRQARGAIMGILRAAPDRGFALTELRMASELSQARFDRAMLTLLADHLVEEDGDLFSLPR